MHAAKVLVALAMMVYMTEGLFLGGAGVAALIGLKALFIKGAIVGGAIGYAARRRHYGRSYRVHRPVHYRKSYSYRRHGRSVEDEPETFDETMSNAILNASLNDGEDCAKKLICSLTAKDPNTLEADERILANVFGKSAGIDLTSTTVEFDLAALMGRQAGKAQCETIYARCPYESKDLMEVMRKEF
jgi:hypothetical protein